MYYFYALRSLKNGEIYKGISSNPQIRLKQHNSGKTRSTRSNRPHELVYIESCIDRIEARKLEKFYKSGCGREKLKNIME